MSFIGINEHLDTAHRTNHVTNNWFSAGAITGSDITDSTGFFGDTYRIFHILGNLRLSPNVVRSGHPNVSSAVSSVPQTYYFGSTVSLDGKPGHWQTVTYNQGYAYSH